jgi:hypothetical protein
MVSYAYVAFSIDVIFFGSIYYFFTICDIVRVYFQYNYVFGDYLYLICLTIPAITMLNYVIQKHSKFGYL